MKEIEPVKTSTQTKIGVMCEIVGMVITDEYKPLVNESNVEAFADSFKTSPMFTKEQRELFSLIWSAL